MDIKKKRKTVSKNNCDVNEKLLINRNEKSNFQKTVNSTNILKSSVIFFVQWFFQEKLTSWYCYPRNKMCLLQNTA